MDTQPKIITQDDGTKIVRIYNAEDLSQEDLQAKIDDLNISVKQSQETIDGENKNIEACQSQIDIYQKYIEQVKPVVVDPVPVVDPVVADPIITP